MRSILIKKSGAYLVVVFCSLLFLNRITCSEEKENFRPKFSIKITGARDRLAIGDINRCLSSINNNDTFDYWRENAPERVVGEITELNNWIDDWEAELRIDITPRIGIGFSTSGSIHKKNESSLTYTDRGWAGDQITGIAFKPDIKVSMPVRLGIYYTLPFSSKFNIFFNAGIGYYSGQMNEHSKYEVTTPSGGYGYTNIYWETDRKSSFGFHGGVGVEYLLTKNLALVLESRGKHVKINDFKGRIQFNHSSGMQNEETGTLYYYTMWNPGIGTRYANLTVWEKPPDFSIYFIDDVKKAVLDLSGYSLRVGIRVIL